MGSRNGEGGGVRAYYTIHVSCRRVLGHLTSHIIHLKIFMHVRGRVPVHNHVPGGMLQSKGVCVYNMLPAGTVNIGFAGGGRDANGRFFLPQKRTVYHGIYKQENNTDDHLQAKEEAVVSPEPRQHVRRRKGHRKSKAGRPGEDHL